MMRYEYSTVEWHKEEEVMGCESLSQILNRKGGSGWIFCTSIARELVFMRPLSAETKDAVQVLAEALIVCKDEGLIALNGPARRGTEVLDLALVAAVADRVGGPVAAVALHGSQGARRRDRAACAGARADG